VLWRAGQERVVREAETEYERMTVAVASGYAIATSKDARSAWDRRKGRPFHDVAGQRAVLSRLAARFPNNVRVN
jgi:hypothetical protein